MLIFARIIFSFHILSWSVMSFAGQTTIDDNGGITWQAGVDGVEVKWGSDGSVKRLYSRQSVPVEFPDRRGINKAQIIAEEKAKGNIIRFMDQSVSTTRIVAEVQSDINRATQQRETNKANNVKKVDDRTIVEALTEITTSFASGKLRGVIVLERGYSDKLDEAWVVVGISERTINASKAVNNMIDNPKKFSMKDASPPPDIEKAANFGEQQSEVRKSTNNNW